VLEITVFAGYFLDKDSISQKNDNKLWGIKAVKCSRVLPFAEKRDRFTAINRVFVFYNFSHPLFNEPMKYYNRGSGTSELKS
jgi:hypothetical protein